MHVATFPKPTSIQVDVGFLTDADLKMTVEEVGTGKMPKIVPCNLRKFVYNVFTK